MYTWSGLLGSKWTLVYSHFLNMAPASLSHYQASLPLLEHKTPYLRPEFIPISVQGSSAFSLQSWNSLSFRKLIPCASPSELPLCPNRLVSLAYLVLKFVKFFLSLKMFCFLSLSSSLFPLLPCVFIERSSLRM